MKLIANVDNNWAIGFKDSLLVNIPADMKRFREITSGHTVVLGRKTLAGFPGGLPLKNRRNIILSKRQDYEVRGAEVVRSTEELFELLRDIDSDDIFVIGGGSVYKLLEPYCDTAYITKVDYSYQADTYFPNLENSENWVMVDESEEQTCFSMIYYFQEYRNKNPKKL
ncbi:MAG: dihydrofolate reductase [Eubacterium sp.]|nr:dihydrofolate reductase [Eubacterium sp.]